jgi:hypothetical protein
VVYDLLMKAAAETTLAIAPDPRRLGRDPTSLCMPGRRHESFARRWRLVAPEFSRQLCALNGLVVRRRADAPCGTERTMQETSAKSALLGLSAE